MKRNFTLVLVCAISILSLLSSTSYSQNQVYWRENFTATSTVTGDPGTTSVPYTYVGAATGTWTMYGVWQTTGTSCIGEGVTGTGNRHIRSTSAVIDGGTAGTTEDDTAYMITPAVSYGVNEVHIYRSRNNRRLSIYKSSDALPNTTNWVLAAVIPKSLGSPVVLCTDTTININDANAKQIRFRFERAGNSDVDSVVLTSVTLIPAPVTFTEIKASAKNAGVEVRWTTAEESGILRYEVETSVDGLNFKKAGVVASTNRSEAVYTWFDALPLQGVNYYRIRAVEYSGAKLTGIMKVNINKLLPVMIIASNPVKGKNLSLRLNGMEKGNYILQVLNNIGQPVFQKNITLEGNSLAQTFQMPFISSGMYSVQLKGVDLLLSQKIIAE